MTTGESWIFLTAASVGLVTPIYRLAINGRPAGGKVALFLGVAVVAALLSAYFYPLSKRDIMPGVGMNGAGVATLFLIPFTFGWLVCGAVACLHWLIFERSRV